MSFQAKEEEPSSDKLLMFSMLGIVAVVGLAFAVSMFGRKESLPAIQPAAAPIVQAAPPADPKTFVNNSMPGPYIPPQEQRVVLPPYIEPPQYQPPPRPRRSFRETGNRKLDGLSDTVGDVG